MQKSGSTCQIRAGLLNDAGTWTECSWYDISNSWNAVEIDYQALTTSGSLTGKIRFHYLPVCMATCS